jgi:hypothetical protein
MTLQLELKPETERSLRAAAEARHVPIEDYVLSLVESSLQSNIIPATSTSQTKEDLQQWFKDMAEFSCKIPKHPGETWSRETLYDDHD